MASPLPDETPKPQAPAAPPEQLQAEAAELRAHNAKLLAQIDELKALAAAPAEAPKDLQRLHLLQIQPVRDILVFLLILGIFWLGYVLRPITIPILLALGLAYLVEPVVRYVTGKHWASRPGAAVAVILAVVLAIFVPLGVGGAFATAQGIQYGRALHRSVEALQASVEKPEDEQLRAAVERKGKLWGYARDAIVKARTPEAAAPEKPDEEAEQVVVRQAALWIYDYFQREPGTLGERLGQRALGGGADVLRFAWHVVLRSGLLIFSLFLVLFFFFFFSIKWPSVVSSLGELVPQRKRDRTAAMLRKMDEVISAFVRGRLTIMLILMGAFTAGYWVIGVPAPLIVGPIVGILAIVPYLGLVSIPACWVLMWVQPPVAEWQQAWWWIIFAPTVLYFIIQASDDYGLTPVIQGKATEMETPTILFAVLAGGILLGIYGMLLAVPVAACLKILIRESFWPRFKAWGEGRVKDFLPISRYDPTETGAP